MQRLRGSKRHQSWQSKGVCRRKQPTGGLKPWRRHKLGGFRSNRRIESGLSSRDSQKRQEPQRPIGKQRPKDWLKHRDLLPLNSREFSKSRRLPGLPQSKKLPDVKRKRS